MKNKLFSVIAIAVVTIGIFALSMTGCDNGTNGTNNPPLTVITIAAIEGVTVPVTGGTPVTTITETAQYTGTVTWNGNPATFAASTVYTATITLSPKTGYTLQGVTANFFTVAGTTSVTNEAHSGVITAVFAATDSDNDTQLRYYSVSIPTAEEEAENFLDTLQQYKWFQNMGYTHVTLPSHPVIDPLKTKILNNDNYYLTTQEQTQVKNAFIKDLFNASDYQLSFPAVRSAVVIADKQIDSLKRYQTAWGFFIPARYTVQLTLYGPGGSYDPSTGRIIYLVYKDGRLASPPLGTILHESVHIGIEEKIVQKYNLSQFEKERIVDQFVKKQFISVVPDFQMQPFNIPAIDKMFENSDVLDKLPQRVEEMLASMKQSMKQEGIEKADSVKTNSTATKLEGYWVNTVSSRSLLDLG